MSIKSPLLILVPHASGHVPADILKQMLGDKLHDTTARKILIENIFKDGDPFTDLIFQNDDAHYLEATVSRFVVDVNREREDKSDNGVIKTVSFAEDALYPDDYVLSEQEREQRLRRYHDSFHGEIESLLANNKISLIISGHSMATYGPNLGLDKGKERPAITLMTGGDINGDDVDTQRNFMRGEEARALHSLTEKHFATPLAHSKIKRKVALNDPWSADILSKRYTNPELGHNLHAFGIELNHALYMDSDKNILPEKVKELNQCFQSFAADCVKLFQ